MWKLGFVEICDDVSSGNIRILITWVASYDHKKAPGYEVARRTYRRQIKHLPKEKTIQILFGRKTFSMTLPLLPLVLEKLQTWQQLVLKGIKKKALSRSG